MIMNFKVFTNFLLLLSNEQLKLFGEFFWLQKLGLCIQVRLWLNIALVVLIEFNCFKEVLYLFILSTFPDEISDSNLTRIKENILNEILNFLVLYLIRDRKNLKASTTNTVNHKLQLYMFQVVNLIKIKHIKQN